MPWRSRPPAPAAERTPPPPSGPETLKDRGLLTSWFLEYRLEEELRRSARQAYPLSVVVLRPRPLTWRESEATLIAVGAAAARAAARFTDLVGWLGEDIIVVLPDTDQAGAAVAADRWRSTMAARCRVLGGAKWDLVANVCGTQFRSASELLEAVDSELERAA